MIGHHSWSLWLFVCLVMWSTSDESVLFVLGNERIHDRHMLQANMSESLISVSTKWTQELAELVRRDLSPDEVHDDVNVILAFTDIVFVAFAEVWYQQLTAVGSNCHVIVCVDMECIEYLQNTTYRIILRPGTRERNIKWLWRLRLDTMYELIQDPAFAGFVISDVDVLWQRTINFEDLKKYDITSGIQAGVKSPVDIYHLWGHVLSHAVMYYRRTGATQSFLQRVSNKCSHLINQNKHCDEQEQLNEIAAKHYKLTWTGSIEEGMIGESTIGPAQSRISIQLWSIDHIARVHATSLTNQTCADAWMVHIAGPPPARKGALNEFRNGNNSCIRTSFELIKGATQNEKLETKETEKKKDNNEKTVPLAPVPSPKIHHLNMVSTPAGEMMMLAGFNPKCTPQVFIMGAENAGGERLHLMLSKHPDYTGFTNTNILDTAAIEIGMERAPGRLDNVLMEPFESCNVSVSEQLVVGDYSLSSFGSCYAGAAVKAMYGSSVHLVVMIRDPNERFISVVRDRKQNNLHDLNETIDEMDVFAREEASLTAQLHADSGYHCLFRPSRNLLYDGMYIVHLRRWMQKQYLPVMLHKHQLYPAHNILAPRPEGSGMPTRDELEKVGYLSAILIVMENDLNQASKLIMKWIDVSRMDGLTVPKRESVAVPHWLIEKEFYKEYNTELYRMFHLKEHLGWK